MAQNYTVEIGFDLTNAENTVFLELDDPVKGLLDSTQYVLGGALFFDVTDDVVDFSVNRGKNRQLDRYGAGNAAITLNNEDRRYDPLYADGPYFGQIIPRRAVRISVDGSRIYTGSIDDWDLSYEVSGRSQAMAVCSDNTYLLANQSLGSATNTTQFPGPRINSILNKTEVNWPAEIRTLDTGETLLQADTISEGTNALSYIQQVAQSEPGFFFVNRDGFAEFVGRYRRTTDTDITFADDGTGIPYKNLEVLYGSELLYNAVTLSQKNGVTVTADDLESQDQYGILTYSVSDLLMDEQSDAVNLATFLAAKYSQPEYRFDRVTVQLDKLDPADKTKLLEADLGDAVFLKFTPNGIGNPIERTAEIIRISHNVVPDSHQITFGLGSLEVSPWRLSDIIFGRLSAGNSLAY
jgi:hypothetical protein